MAFRFGSLVRGTNGAKARLTHQEYTALREKTGFSVTYDERPDGIAVTAVADDGDIVVLLPNTSTGEARILYMEATEFIMTRAELGLDHAAIRSILEQLFAQFRR